ncbi:MAG TPA: hypothetical protein VGP47_11590 [Parachlamydiaceae bacterium]|nr:hypothetical protein [Parachlamydiaceae bacterium]
MNPIAFPEQIRNFFQGHLSETTEESELRNIFKESAAVKKAFIEWAEVNPNVVSQEPRLYKAFSIAQEGPPLAWGKKSESISQIFKNTYDDTSYHLIKSILANQMVIIRSFPEDYVSVSLGLFESGIIDKNELITLFSKRNSVTYEQVFHNAASLEMNLPHLMQLDKELIVSILSIPDRQGDTVLHKLYTLKKVIPLLQTLDVDSIVKIYSFTNGMGKVLLHDKRVLGLLSSVLNKFDFNDSLKILSITDKDGKTPFHNMELIQILIPLLNNRSSTELHKVLTVRDKSGQIPLHNKEIYALFLPILPKLGRSEFVELNLCQDENGLTPLHNADIFGIALPLLNKLNKEGLNEIFSKKYDGNTLLHDPVLLAKAGNLLKRISRVVLKIRSKENISPMEWVNCRLSNNWLVKDKVPIHSKPLTKEEYQLKAAVLKLEIDNLWSSFVFGEEDGEVPSEYLRMEISNTSQIFTPDEIKAALDSMTDKINDQLAWLGTPSAENPEALHLFYSQMLTNFEELVSLLNTQDMPAEKAGPLINLAKVILEGRCAAAYQSEIEQSKMLISSSVEGEGIDANFNKMALASLTECIERIVREKAKGDSHFFSQMLFSVGMAPAADPLSRVPIENCQNVVKSVWTKDKAVSSLTEILGRLDVDQLEYWFKLRTPVEYGKEYSIKQAEIQKEEQVIVQEAKLKLKQNGLEDALVDSTLELFQSSKGAGLRVGSPQRNYLSESLFSKLDQVSTVEELLEAQKLYDLENQIERDRKLELLGKEDLLNEKPKETLTDEEKKLLAAYVKERRELQQKNIGEGGEFRAMKLQAETKIKMYELIHKANPMLTKENFDFIISAKKSFDEQILALVDKSEVSFSPWETGLPSIAQENLRKHDYASQFFIMKDEKMKLNKRGTMDILFHLGILESSK